jgi:crotonobetaine/carnitine-CoA ligase
MNTAGLAETVTWGPPTKATLGSALAGRAAERPDKVCLTFEDGPVTYRQLDESTNAVANSLARLGVGPGDRVAVFMPNSRAVVEAWFAVAKLGGIYVGVNTAYVGDYLRHQLATAGCKVVITDAELGERIRAVAGGVPSLEHGVIADGDESEKLTMAELRAGPGDRLRVERPARWDDPCAIQYTAGTTGPSKGALITQNYLLRSSELLRGQMAMEEDHVAYTPLPLFHLNAMICTILPAILSGASAVIDPWFSVSRYWEQVRRHGATHISLLGPMMVMLWNQPPRDDDAANSVAVMLCAPVPTDIHRPFEERFGLDIVTAYGLSEAVPILLSLPTPPGYAGRPSPVFDVRLFDDEDQEVAVGEVGEIVCRPREPHVMFEGYFNNPEATVGMWRNLWFHTGDLGRSNDDGYIQFVDRKKDYLRRRGENVSSYEAEQAIRAHASVADAAVFGVPSEIGEDDVMACVVVKPGEELTFEALLAHCIGNMPYFAVPRYIEFLDALPRNPVGRVLKHELRSRGVTGATFDRGPGRPALPSAATSTPG